MSTPGPERVPSTVKVGKTSGQGKPPTSKSTPAKAAGSKPGGAKGGAGKGPKGRKPITPIKVNASRNWGPILVAGVVVLLAVGIVGFGVFAVIRDKQETSTPWAERARAISGVTDYRDKYPDLKQVANHKPGVLTYPVNPPVGGPHSSVWQNCNGDVYSSPIPKENAMHSLEHGAVWITYKPGLDPAQVEALAAKVQGKDFMMISPFTGLDQNISLQGWGFQLKVADASDPRIDDFIKAVRVNASMEPGVPCSGGSTTTGDVPATKAS